MTSDSSHCDYSGLRCITVLKALKPKVQKGPFCISDSLFFRLSSQSRFFPLNKQLSVMLDARLNTNTNADKVTVFNSQGQKGIESVKGSHYHGHIENLSHTHTNIHVVINTHPICKLPPGDKGSEVHKQSSEKLSVMVVDNGDGSPLVQSAIFKFK